MAQAFLEFRKLLMELEDFHIDFRPDLLLGFRIDFRRLCCSFPFQWELPVLLCSFSISSIHSYPSLSLGARGGLLTQ